MKKYLLLSVFFFGILLFNSLSQAQILSPIAQVKGQLDQETTAIFIGETHLQGSFEGYQLSSIITIPLFSDALAFPFLGSTVFKDIDTLIMYSLPSLNTTSLEELLFLDEDNITFFTDVDIDITPGPVVLAAYEQTSYVTINNTFDYAFTSLLTIDITQDASLPFLTLVTPSEQHIFYHGDSTYLIPLTNSSSINIKNQAGHSLWKSNLSNVLFLIEDEEFSCVSHSLISLFSLATTFLEGARSFSIKPAQTSTLDFQSILTEISTLEHSFTNLSNISSELQGFEAILDEILTIINGGMILLKTTDTLFIDGSPQTFSEVGFGRGELIEIMISNSSEPYALQGNFRLIFLGDHLYTVRAQDSSTGVTLPFLIVIVWIIALAAFFLFKYYLKKEINEQFDTKIKKYAFYFHIIALLLAFFLLDQEISFQFGISALDVLFGHGLTIFIGIFLVVELIMWVLGYFLLAFPVRLIVNSTLQWFGIGKGGKSIGKGIGAFFIWIFCALYVKVIVNLLFLVLNPANFFQGG